MLNKNIFDSVQIRCAPNIRYNPHHAQRLAHFQGNLGDLIELFFAGHSPAYRIELNQIALRNGELRGDDTRPLATRCFVIIPAMNEEKNLRQIVNQLGTQSISTGTGRDCKFMAGISLVVIVNSPDEAQYAQSFEDSLQVLRELQEEYSNLHIVAKKFKADEACLGRARKYGIDYCLNLLAERESEEIARSFIVCCEGDTESVPVDYLERYSISFENGEPLLAQGIVAYPQRLIDRYEPFAIFTECRESLIVGQGSRSDIFPHFNGIMPVGRNMAFSPELYLRTGGIDPIRRRDTDDDINWGVDINRYVSPAAKKFVPVPLITSPRREISILSDICRGLQNSLRDSYAAFHSDRSPCSAYGVEIEEQADRFIPALTNPWLNARILGQMYQWIISTCLKERMWNSAGVEKTMSRYLAHQIGYWEKEALLWDIFVQTVTDIDAACAGRTIADEIAGEAFRWFLAFNRSQSLGVTLCRRGLDSVLIEEDI